MIRLIALDFDGTLVPKKEKTADINCETLKLLNQLREMGVILVLATGRHPSYIRKRVKSFKFDWIIGYSANIICKDEIIFSEQFDRKEIIKVHEYFLDNFEQSIILYTNDAIVITTNQEDYEKLCLNLLESDKLVDYEGVSKKTIKEIINEHNMTRICRICVRSGNFSLLKKIQESFNDDFDDFRLVKTGYRQLEILRKDKSKGVEILKIAKSLSIRENEIAVIGDDENDKEMLQMFRNSFYVGESNNELATIATYKVNDCREALKLIMENSNNV